MAHEDLKYLQRIQLRSVIDSLFEKLQDMYGERVMQMMKRGPATDNFCASLEGSRKSLTRHPPTVNIKKQRVFMAVLCHTPFCENKPVCLFEKRRGNIYINFLAPFFSAWSVASCPPIGFLFVPE